MLPNQDDFIEKLFRAHFYELFRYAMVYLHNEHRAEELVQDTFHGV